MNTLAISAALFGGFLVLNSAHAGVSFSIDTITTQTSTTWGGSPAGTLAQSIALPIAQNGQDGGPSSGIIFKAASSFTLGAIEIDEAYLNVDNGGNFNLFLYDLGSSYVLPATSPVYTFTGTELNLLSGGLNVTLASANQFDLFTFSGADNVHMASGDSYLFNLVSTDGSSLSWDRGPITANQDIAVNGVVVGGAGTVLNNGNAAANRTPIAAFFAVPEPSSLALLGLGALAGLGFIRRRNG